MSESRPTSELGPHVSGRHVPPTDKPPAIHDWEVDGPSNRFGSLWQSYMRNGEWLGILTWRHFPDVDLDELDERAMTLRYRPEAKPGIALVIDAGVRDGKLWVLEEVETKDTVADVALNEGFDSAASLDRLVRSIGRSMEALHQQRIVHGAISADSFHMRADGTCELAHGGLGTIRHLEARFDGPEALNAGLRAGARAPELAAGDKPTAASDRYALGAAMYQAVTGVEPSPADLEPGAVSELLRSLGAAVPTSVRGSLPRLLSPEPSKRAAGLTVLHRFGGERPAAAPRPRSTVNDTEQTMAVPAQPDLIGREVGANPGQSPWAEEPEELDETTIVPIGFDGLPRTRTEDIPAYRASGPIKISTTPTGAGRSDDDVDLTTISGPNAATNVLWTPQPNRLGGSLGHEDEADDDADAHVSRKDRRRPQPPNPSKPWLVAALAVVATIAGLIVLTREDGPSSRRGSVVAGAAEEAGASETSGGDDSEGGSANAGQALSGMSVTIGSKAYTEQRILVEIVAEALEAQGAVVERQFNMGGTPELREALLDGNIQMYPEFNATAWSVIWEETDEPPAQGTELTKLLDTRDKAENGIEWVGFAPFNNTYGFAVRQATAELDGIATTDDLVEWIESDDSVVVCMEPDFRSRVDGLARFEEQTGFAIPEGQIKELAGSDIYLALAAEECDVGEVFTTDGRLVAMHLAVVDGADVFEPYNISMTVDAAVLKKYPAAAGVIDKALAGLDTQTMTRLNSEVDVLGSSEATAAYSYLESRDLEPATQNTAKAASN